ncbi:ogr/Delta-like zinc finger family protein [Propionivibrio limicola]|uniref:ogr/Delta-like zinc finger family protein n=1 Tax=Propionivibrio limicola TaxID=167645 RepID=UPI00129244D0|nr:ogr/Delta-like zinc finger family protein [Propionivibrio limicola]
MSQVHFNQWRVLCPHCGSESTVRSSKQLSETVREAKVQCNNPDCAHTWIAQLAALRTIAPSMMPNPKVFIPLSPRSPAAQPPADAQLELGMSFPHPRMAPSG